MSIDPAFALVDGKCPVCETTVDHVINGQRVHFTPHDDPNWCRGAALLLVRTLKRALEQNVEDVALIRNRESFYRAAYSLALRELRDRAPDTDWKRRVEMFVIQHDVNEQTKVEIERRFGIGIKKP